MFNHYFYNSPFALLIELKVFKFNSSLSFLSHHRHALILLRVVMPCPMKHIPYECHRES